MASCEHWRLQVKKFRWCVVLSLACSLAMVSSSWRSASFLAPQRAMAVPGHDLAAGIGSPDPGGLTPAITSLQDVGQTITTLAVSPGTSITVGTPVTLTATVSLTDAAPIAEGAVTFTDNGVPIASCPAAIPVADGQASCQTSELSPGNRQIVATFSGADDDLGSASDPAVLAVSGADNAEHCTVTQIASDDGLTPGTLRTFANQIDPACGTITFDTAQMGSTTVQLIAGTLFVGTSGGDTYPSQSMTIDGGGTVTIQGDGTDAGIVVDPSTSLTLRGLTITGAGSSGLVNLGTLNVENCVLASNSAPYGGGALYNDGNAGTATVVLSDTTITGNTAAVVPWGGGPGSGGALYNDGDGGNASIQVVHSTLVGNSAFSGGAIFNTGDNGTASIVLTGTNVTANTTPGWGFGGALFDSAANGTATIELDESTISNNSAGGAGAIYSDGFGGTAAITTTDTTISANVASGGSGGAIVNDGDWGLATLAVNSSTLSDNQATDGGAILNYGDDGTASFTATNSTLSGNSATNGGAIYNDGFYDGNSVSATAAMTLTNSTLSGNHATAMGAGIFSTADGGAASVAVHSTVLVDAINGECGGDTLATDDDYNLALAAANGCDLTAGNDLFNAIPGLEGGAVDNGGPTHTVALLPGSPAIGSGDCTEYTSSSTGYQYTPVTTDQRGVARGTPCDTGAVEGTAAAVVATYQVQPGWNLISLPLAPTTPISASTLLAGLLAQTGDTYVEIDSLTNGAWTPSYFQEVSPQPLTGGNDYTLALGHGYALYSAKAGSISFSGIPAAAPTVSLSRGWNLVGFPDAYGSANSAHASAVLSALLAQTQGNYAEMDGFTDGQWTPSYFEEISPTVISPSDYSVTAGQGYALYTDVAGSQAF